MSPNFGSACKTRKDCSGSRVVCSAASEDYSVRRVIKEILALGERAEDLRALAHWVAYGNGTEMGRVVVRCRAPDPPSDNSTNSSNASVTYSHADALIDACAKDFDHDANGVFSREELVDLWKLMQQRALDPYQTSREFYMILQVHPPFLFHPSAYWTASMKGMESAPSEGVRAETDAIEFEVYLQDKIGQA